MGSTTSSIKRVNYILWFKKKRKQHTRETELNKEIEKYMTMGEKPTKYFLNLENRNFVSKHIRELKQEGKTINKPKDILNEMNFFYQNLYNEKDIIDIDNSNYSKIEEKITKLNDSKNEELERDISMEDLRKIVYNSKNNKSPGPDGFSNEFYKVFWSQIKTLLLKLIIFYKEWGVLKVAQTNGIITCIPKGRKCRSDLKN